MAAYDWQFAAVGNGAYDYAYFVALVADPDDRRRLEPELKRSYLAARAAAGAPPLRDLEADASKGALLALASFVMGAATAGDDDAAVATHRKGLVRLATAARDWGAARALPGGAGK